MLKVRILLIAVAVTAGTLGLPAAAFAGTASLPFGLYQASNDLQYQFPRTPAYAIQYYSWGEGFQAASAAAAQAAGTEPFLELQSCGWPCNAASSVSLDDIAAGKQDAYLTAYAQAVAAFGHPVLMTFDHEMNGNWYPWGYQAVTPAQWIAAWRHVTSVMSAIAPDIVWVWAPNLNTTYHHPLSDYWPGSAQACGIDGYLSSPASTWAATIAPSVASLKAVCGAAPWYLAETGVNSSDSNAVAQVDDLVAGARSAGAVALMYFDRYQFTFSPATQAEFLADTGG